MNGDGRGRERERERTERHEARPRISIEIRVDADDAWQEPKSTRQIEGNTVAKEREREHLDEENQWQREVA